MTLSVLAAKVDSYKMLEDEYQKMEALCLTAMERINIDYQLLLKSRLEIVAMRKAAESLIHNPDDLN